MVSALGKVAKGLHGELSKSYGIRQEDRALDVYEQRTRRPVASRNETYAPRGSLWSLQSMKKALSFFFFFQVHKEICFVS